jgi:hypothetical protein
MPNWSDLPLHFIAFIVPATGTLVVPALRNARLMLRDFPLAARAAVRPPTQEERRLAARVVTRL